MRAEPGDRRAEDDYFNQYPACPPPPRAISVSGSSTGATVHRRCGARVRTIRCRDVSQPIKPTALEQSVLFTWPACDDGGFGKRLRVAWLLAPPAWLSKEE